MSWSTLRDLLGELVIVQLAQGAIVQKYAQIAHFSENVMKPARPMGQNDMWIAATASATGATLLTSDSDFDHLDPSFITRIRFDSKTGKQT
ncbi:MAG: PIN domain-containing protein [Chloroflexi bacterium]|nr:PIN domain-containing protein [Chloroflexota bacterium]